MEEEEEKEEEGLVAGRSGSVVRTFWRIYYPIVSSEIQV